MTGHDDFDRTLTDWLEAEAARPVPAGGLGPALDATSHRQPRPRWIARPGSHWTGQPSLAGSSLEVGSLTGFGMRLSTALIVLLAIAALAGGVVFVAASLMHPSPLPTGSLGQLAYGLNGDIFVADWDGRNSVRIADGHADGRTDCQGFTGEGPMWSPDGRHLAYRSRNDCDHFEGTVYLSDPEGHSVVSFPGQGWLVSWSPDSSRVATWADSEPRTIGIYGLDGRRQALLALPPGYGTGRDEDPIWSSDGMSLLVSLRPHPWGDPRQTWELPIDGRAPRPLPVDDPRSHWASFAYSRDGARVAYIDYPESASLVIVRSDSTGPRTLFGARTQDNGVGPGAAYEDPVLSSTGDRVAFIWSPELYDRSSDLSASPFELRMVEVASGTVTTLARATGNFPLTPIGFSPDGDRILFSRTEPNDVTALWSVKADGSDALLLVPGSDWGDWQWQPPGS